MHCVVPFNKRLFEWIGALMFCGLGFELMLTPRAVGSSAFRYMLEVLNPRTLAYVYFMIGEVRLISLILNGKLIWGPGVRALCSLASAVIWLQMVAALVRFYLETSNPTPPVVSMFVVLFLAEVYSTYRAVSDGRSYLS